MTKAKSESIHKAVADAINACMLGDRFTIADTVKYILDTSPELVDEFAQALAEAQLRNIAKKMLARMNDTDDQPAFPGMRLPVAIMIRKDDTIYYVSASRATWVEVQAGYLERQHNKRAVEAKLDQYRNTMRQLEPIMKPAPEMTVAEAMEFLRSKAA